MLRPNRLLILLLSLLACGPAAAAPQIAIIIDDLGYQLALGEQAINLPGPVAYAVLPGAPRAAYLAEVADSKGKEVLIHLPLQAERPAANAEPDSLTLDMTEPEFMALLNRHLAAIPQASGVNTHRGSLLTRHPGHMNWLMRGIAEHGVTYFVDSYTTADSIALQIAREHRMPAMRRHVFLDPDRSTDTVPREFERLKSIALEQGYAVGIGHPYPATLEYLAEALPALAHEGFELVSIEALVALRGNQAPAATSGE